MVVVFVPGLYLHLVIYSNIDTQNSDYYKFTFPTMTFLYLFYLKG